MTFSKKTKADVAKAIERSIGNARLWNSINGMDYAAYAPEAEAALSAVVRSPEWIARFCAYEIHTSDDDVSYVKASDYERLLRAYEARQCKQCDGTGEEFIPEEYADGTISRTVVAYPCSACQQARQVGVGEAEAVEIARKAMREATGDDYWKHGTAGVIVRALLAAGVISRGWEALPTPPAIKEG